MSNTTSEFWFRRHPKLALSSIVLILCFVTLFFVEFILGFTNSTKLNDISKNARSVNIVEYAPLIDTYAYPTDEYCKRFETKGLVQKNYTFRTDRKGYIMPSTLYANPDITITFLGGSTIGCKFMDEKNRFPHLSRELIEEKTGKKINVLNAGVSGMNSMQGLNVLINKLIPEDPDYVTIMFTINDLATLLYTGTYWNTSNRSLIMENVEYSIVTTLKVLIRKSIPNTYSLIGNIFTKENKDEWAQYRNKKERIDSGQICASFKSSLTTLINTCENFGITPILMTQGNRFSLNDVDLEQPENLINKHQDLINAYYLMTTTIRETAAENNIVLIDLEKTVPKDTLHLYDKVHLTDAGSVVAATEIASVLTPIIKESEESN